MSELRAAIVGAGVFGGYHAAKYAELDGVRLTAVHDISFERASRLAALHGAAAYADLDAVFAAADVVTIASPAHAHFELARRALAAGKHVLVEKPIAMRLDQADALVAQARAAGLVLQVGHQERYVFDALGALRRSTGPREIVCRRCGPFSGRGVDVSVVFDLMIHDLDLIRQVTDGDPVSIEASQVVRETEQADETVAQLIFRNGTQVRLIASRIADARQRDMRLVYDDGAVEIDFIARHITNTTPEPLACGFDAPDAPAALRDPLAYGVKTFVACVRSGAAPIVTGKDGRDALAWALDIEAAAAIPAAARAAS